MNGGEKGRTVCSYCGEEISLDAKRCPYCGSVLKLEKGLNIDEVKTDSFNNDGSPMQDKDRYFSQGRFDNSINTDNNASDFTQEEKYNDKNNGLFDSKANEPLKENSGLFDSNPNEQLKENSGLFDSNLNEQLKENSELFDNKTNEQLKENSGLFGVNSNGQVEESIDKEVKSDNPNQITREPRPVDKPEMGKVLSRKSPPTANVPGAGASVKPSLTNARKVFITTGCNFIPGIGQLVGVIIAIVFMNNEDDTDKRSFGVALLVSSIVVFVLWAISCCVLAIAFSEV